VSNILSIYSHCSGAEPIFQGGLSFTARKHGWACENIVDYEVVLASGEIVNATSSSNPDLWLAVKGGSNNFGIIMRFHLATYSQGNMLGGDVRLQYTSKVLNSQAHAFSNFMKPENFDEENREYAESPRYAQEGHPFGVRLFPAR